MAIDCVNKNPITTFCSPTAFVVRPADPSLTKILDAYGAAKSDAVAQIRPKRYADAAMFIIGPVGSLDELTRVGRVRGELERVVAATKSMDVKNVEIEIYFPRLREKGERLGVAVKDYLVRNDVSKEAIEVTLRGPGCADDNRLVILITGNPKPDTQDQDQEEAPIVRRAVELLSA
jgi:hypothetical protein